MAKNTSLQSIINHFKSNVSPEYGATNEIIHRFCERICCNYYEGMFTAINPPFDYFAQQDKFTVIVNIGSHFITIYADKNFILYIDPLGISVNTYDKRLIRFLKKCKRKIFYNTKKIQNFSSMFCGLYAILFCKFFDEERSNDYKLKFYPNGDIKNDKLCVEYLNKLVD